VFHFLVGGYPPNESIKKQILASKLAESAFIDSLRSECLPKS
jgi:hypothetical protein